MVAEGVRVAFCAHLFMMVYRDRYKGLPMRRVLSFFCRKMPSFKRRDVFLCASGLFDHYDTALYGFLAPFMAPFFFPHTHFWVQLILSYSVFVVGILFRPLGVLCAFYMAHKGLYRPLHLSMPLLAFCMFLMALLPTHAQVGFLAPLILFTVRALIDFSVALERCVIKFALIDRSKDKTALRLSSAYEVASLMGTFFACLAPFVMKTLIAPQHFPHAWRLFFLLGALCAALVALLRKRFLGVASPKNALKLKGEGNFSRTVACLFKRRLVLLRLSLAHSFSYATYSFAFIIIALLMPMIFEVKPAIFFERAPLFWGIDVLCFFGIALFCGHTPPQKLMKVALLALIVTLVPLFLLWGEGVAGLSFVLRIWIIVWGVVFSAALPLWERAITPLSPERYLLSGLARAFGSGILGRNLVALTLFVFHLFPSPLTPALILTCLACAALWALREREAILPFKRLMARLRVNRAF